LGTEKFDTKKGRVGGSTVGVPNQLPEATFSY